MTAFKLYSVASTRQSTTDVSHLERLFVRVNNDDVLSYRHSRLSRFLYINYLATAIAANGSNRIKEDSTVPPFCALLFHSTLP